MKQNKFLHSLKWFFLSFIWIVPLVIILDQTTKLIVDAQQIKEFPIIKDFFYIDLRYNTGAAWSIFDGNQIILGLFSLLAGSVMVGYLVWRYQKMSVWNRVSLLLMIGGCFGNMIDRLFYSDGVIDFLSFRFGKYIFPTFNLADAFLVIGVLLLIVLMLIEEFKGPKKKEIVEVKAETQEVNEVTPPQDHE